MIFSKLKQLYLLFGILCTFALSILFPLEESNGPTNSKLNILAVCLTYFASGFNICQSDFVSCLQRWKLHAFIQFFTFVLTPIMIRVFLLIVAFLFSMDNWIVIGLIAVSCMPPPTSSVVTLTRLAKGNEVVAVLNSAFGIFLSIFLTPLLLLFHVGMSTTLPLLSTLFQIMSTIVGPLAAGQIVRRLLPRGFLRRSVEKLSEVALLITIYTSFCDLFLKKEFTVHAHEVLITLFVAVLIQISLMEISLRSALKLDRSKSTLETEDLVALVYCSTHKSFTLGLSLLRTLYGGYSHLSQISLSLLLYYPTQLILGALFAPFAASYVARYNKLKKQPSSASSLRASFREDVLSFNIKEEP